MAVDNFSVSLLLWQLFNIILFAGAVYLLILLGRFLRRSLSASKTGQMDHTPNDQ